jgi:hypothetical protein
VERVSQTSKESDEGYLDEHSEPMRYRGSIWKSDMCKTFNRFPCLIVVTLIQIRRELMQQRSELTLGGGTTLELGRVVL